MTSQSETWVPVSGYENLYEVSNLRRIRTKKRQIVDSDGNVVTTVPNREVEVHTSYGSEPYVILSNGKTYHKTPVNLLFAQAQV